MTGETVRVARPRTTAILLALAGLGSAAQRPTRIHGNARQSLEALRSHGTLSLDTTVFVGHVPGYLLAAAEIRGRQVCELCQGAQVPGYLLAAFEIQGRQVCELCQGAQ